ncbi:MAG: DNA primase DnaG [Haloferacaceae archaeon]
MDDTSKYLIHAAITADGVVERSDVVGAIFGQTEGLLGDGLDLRDLQQSSKVGRIDVEVASEGGQSFGEVTIASSLDRVETAILAASLETLTRVGPCRAQVEITEIEDVRKAKRREVVERAKELLAESFDDGVMTSGDILRQVREAAKVDDITEYEGLPAGPRVPDSDAIIVVEGRADVLTLLGCGIKNAIAVEGTDVPDAVADLTGERTVTAFLDGDRGGELILRELAQVGDVDYVAFAPEGRSVEDLDRSEVMAALREKVPHDRLPTDGNRRAAAKREGEADGGPSPAARKRTTDGAGTAEPPHGGTEADAPGGTTGDATDGAEGPSEADGTADAGAAADAADAGAEESTDTATEGTATDASAAEEPPDASAAEEPPDATTAEYTDDDERAAETASVPEDGAETAEATRSETDGEAADRPQSLRAHVEAIVNGGTGRVRILDEDLTILAEDEAGTAFDRLEAVDGEPWAVVLDGELSQRLLDVAAQRGVDHAIPRSTGEFVKRPVGVRIRTADQLTA